MINNEIIDLVLTCLFLLGSLNVCSLLIIGMVWVYAKSYVWYTTKMKEID